MYYTCYVWSSTGKYHIGSVLQASQVLNFADGIKCSLSISSNDECIKLQQDIIFLFTYSLSQLANYWFH